MTRAQPPYIPQGPPFDSWKEEIDWQLYLLSRRLRIARGLPPNPDTEVLASMLYELHLLATISSPVPLLNAVSAVTPPMPNLLYSDLNYAFPWANLTQTFSWRQEYRASNNQLSSAFAGLGYGLCKSWADLQKCAKEEKTFPQRDVIAIEFIDSKLDISYSIGRTPHQFYTYVYESFPDFGFNHSDSPGFWAAVRDRITTVVREADRKPNTLILLGERAGNKKFLDTVWEALGELELRDIYKDLQVEGFDPDMVCVRGAAEMGKRAQGEPRNCVEGDWCRERRKGEDGMGEDRTGNMESSVESFLDGVEEVQKHELV
jgi:hypothetical protein